MDSSSEDSFAWTHASGDSLDSDTMSVSNTIEKTFDEESESGKSYKKKLKKRLFLNSEHSDGYDSNEKLKGRKFKQENGHDVDTRNNYIKPEPESDVEILKRKKKCRSKDTTNICDDSQESNDESFLNLKVKEEQVGGPIVQSNAISNGHHSTVPVISHIPASEEQDSLVLKKKKKKKSKPKEPSDEDCNNDMSIDNSGHELEQNFINKNHKKKKKCKDRSNVDSDNDDIIIEDKFDAEDTIIGIVEVDTDHNERGSLCDGDSLVKGKTQEHNNVSSSHSKHNEPYVDNIIEQNSKHKKASPKIKIQKKTHNTSHPVANEDEAEEFVKSSCAIKQQFSIPDKTNQRVSKISDRITFEDDSDMDTTQNCLQDNAKSMRRKQFNSHDDEIWILKCPSEVNIEALQGANLKLDTKCKIKLEGQTYEGNVEDNKSRIPIVTSENGTFVTKILSLGGVINIHKRIPKAHFPEANLTVNNQTDFIPLPETKCRHPLFGLNYKKAIKIPSAIAQRLSQFDEQPIKHNTKKLHKKSKEHKHKPKTEDIAMSVNPQNIDLVAVVKNKKRKHTDDNAIPAKKLKRNKCPELDCAEGWESEKAIEKNLFDF